MNPEAARIALQLIERATLSGKEVEAYLFAKAHLEAVIVQAQAPADPAATADAAEAAG